MSFIDEHHRDLRGLSLENRLRRLVPRTGLDFSSNDYLGLTSAPELQIAVAEALARGVPLGSGGSRLLRGNHEEHEALEAETAQYFGSESALFFSSGFAANSALLSTLPQRGDLIVHDALVHASSHEGMRLGRASYLPAQHNDPESFRDVISGWRRDGGRGRVWIAVESVYSMEGDCAPLDALFALAGTCGAFLIADEAHATGVFGAGGRGLAAHLEGRENVITVRTCGKALGCEGALVCGPAVLKDFLINRGRGFIFSTAPSPLMAAAVRASLRLLDEQPERRIKLRTLIEKAEQHLVPLGARACGTQIMPLILGDDRRTMMVAERLQQAGFDVRGIRPPTVPAGTSRLRISLTLNVDGQAVEALASAISDALP